ncbi:MAG: hypothetical protein K8R88_02755 [Armatimonadetes bacterium]|nr:hypothetical protein [Armatimonadota bacterium]
MIYAHMSSHTKISFAFLSVVIIMNLRFAILAVLLPTSSLSFAQWNSQKIEAFAGEFRLLADSLPKHKAGQMIGALAMLGIASVKEESKANLSILDRLIKDPAELRRKLDADREVISFVNLMFNVTSTMGDYERATKLVKALDGSMWLLGAETAFLEAPYASQLAILPLVIGSSDKVDLMAAMMKGAARADQFDQVAKHTAEIVALVKAKGVDPTPALMDRFLDLKMYGKAVDVVAANPKSKNYAKNLCRLSVESYRGGDYEALDRIALLLGESVKGSPLGTSPELIFAESMRSKETQNIMGVVAKVIPAGDFRFNPYLKRHAEALQLRAQATKVQDLLSAYPKSLEAIIQGVLVAQARMEDAKGVKESLKLLPRRQSTLEFLIAEGLCDDAATLFDELQGSLDARSHYYNVRNLAKGFLDQYKVDRAVEYLQKAKSQILKSDPSFSPNDSNLSDLATLFGQTGDLSSLKELLGRRKVNDYPKLGEAVQDSFMVAYRAGLIRIQSGVKAYPG